MITKPVYFLDISIENVACFGEKQILDLSNGEGRPAQWTVILGDNGTGKSTLLRCLVEMEPFFTSETTTDSGKVWIYSPKGAYYFQPGYFIKDGAEASSLEINQFYTGTFTEGIETFDGYFLEREGGALYKTDSASRSSYISSYSRSHNNNLGNLVLYAYGSLRRRGKGALSETVNQDSSATLFYEDSSLINVEEWFLQADYAVKNSDGETGSYMEKRYNKIKELLIELLPDVSDIRVKTITKSQLKPAMEAKTPYGWVGLENLSLGYQALIASVLDLAHRLFERYPNSQNPLAEPAIVLIDGIDIHLHPKWQKNLINNISIIFKQTQFVVSSYSPLIVQSAKDVNIVLLKREGGQVKIYNRMGGKDVQELFE
ncbi:MAG: AAA family ATPase [bacterium]|nr:AAA family ATPase [bacterium]